MAMISRPGADRQLGGNTVYFDANRFDPDTGMLYRAADAVQLRPKTAQVLAVLVADAGRVVSKQALLEAVWPDEFVGDDALARCVSELRSALADDIKQPRYIATAHRRGYRFIAPVTSTPQVMAADAPHALLVGRDDELARLDDWWRASQRGPPTVVFVAADAGVGKTALVNDFVDQLQRREGVLVGRGHCVDQVGGGEAYLPFLDAIDDLCQGADGALARDALRTHAPSWLLQLPGLRSEEEVASLRQRTGEASSGRMMRELAAALGAVSSVTPVVLVCEDLQAADLPSIEVLGDLAESPQPARVFVVCCYRPAEAIVRSHPLRNVVADLRARQRCRFLALELLSATDVGAYLAARLAPDEPSESLVEEIHARTEGNALFMAAWVDHLVEHGLLVADEGGLRCSEPIERLGIPDTVRGLIERQFDELAVADRVVLEVASVAGVEFAAAEAVAAVGHDRPELPATEVEDHLATLAGELGILTEKAVRQWPDGTVTTLYRFHHAIYQEILYSRLPPTRQAAAHRRIGERLAAAYASRSGELATEPAVHLDRGGG